MSGGRRAAAARRAEWSFALIFSGLFLALGAQLAFYQLWLEDWGVPAAEIGVLNASALVVRVAAGVIMPALADRWNRPRRMMMFLAALGALAAVAHMLASARWQFYPLTVALSVAYSGLMPMSDSHGYQAAERLGFSYRRARSAGSAAFLAATFLMGVLVQERGYAMVMPWIAGAMLLAVVGMAWAPLRGRRAPVRFGALGFLRNGSFGLFLLSVALLQSAHVIYYVYGSLHWSRMGYSGTMIGALWAVGVLAEIVLFFLGRSVLAGLGPVPALMLAGVLSAARWSAMAWDPPLGLLLPLQALHAGSFALTHLAALEFIARAAPKGAAATAQGLAMAAGGLAMAAGSLAAAWLYPRFGGLAYFEGAALALAGALAALALARLWRGERIVVPA